MSVITLHWHSI